MLFDLRSRGRRRTVQGVYLGLALLMGGGLVLFGVGAGNGVGGLLNAFTGGGSNNQSQVVSQQEKQALRQTRLHPTDPSGWASLVQARWTSAGQGSNYNPTTSTFTTSGKQELAKMATAWDRYLQLTKNPDPNTAILAARGLAQLGNFSGAGDAWEISAAANPGSARNYECLAASAYAASQTRKGDLATAKAVALVPKLQRTTTQKALQAAKTSPQTAQQIAQQQC
ncbi:MAG: hypothetical protein WBP81_33445 [Solirubrobacteraceae bacterium]